MNREIYNMIKIEYEKRQKAALEALNSRKAEVYSKIPGFEQLDAELQLLNLKHTRAILAGKDPAGKTAADYMRMINALVEEKKMLLTKAGYPEDYLEMKYYCGTCKDTGFVESENGFRKCACYRQQLINHIFSQSNLKLAEKENFSTFRESLFPDTVDEEKYGIKISPRENILRIKQRCLSFIENFDKPEEKNLFFSGPAGVGKTFMSNCIAMELIMRGRTVLYQSAPSLFRCISEYKMKSGRDEESFVDDLYENIFEADLLIIDDLGTEPPTASRYAELLNILNTRQIKNFTRPCKTIISTNIGARELYEYYSERVASRIIGCFDRLRFAGNDLRLNGL